MTQTEDLGTAPNGMLISPHDSVDTITITEAADLLRCSRRSVGRMLDDGRLRSHRQYGGSRAVIIGAIPSMQLGPGERLPFVPDPRWQQARQAVGAV